METSWENSHSWYDKTVGERGHYYHQSVIFPKTLNLLKFKKEISSWILPAGKAC
jgi:hypothetical protein